MEFRGGRTGGGKLKVIGREPKRDRRARRLGLGMERLEERVVLSSLQWSGADAISRGNNTWSDGGNWVGGSAPAAGDSVTFPTGLTGAALTSVDDMSGLSLAGLTIAGQNYSISAAANVTLALTAPLDASQTSGSSTFNVPVDFGGSAGTITVDNQAAALAMGGEDSIDAADKARMQKEIDAAQAEEQAEENRKAEIVREIVRTVLIVGASIGLYHFGVKLL